MRTELFNSYTVNSEKLWKAENTLYAFEELLDQATQQFGAEYVEIRAQQLSKTTITMKEGRAETAKQGIEQGVALRVLLDGAWGFASAGSFDIQVLSRIMQDACKMAKATSSSLKTPIKLAHVKTYEDKVKIKTAKNPAKIPIGEKIDTLCRINKRVLGYDKRLKSCTVEYLDVTGTSYFFSSEGARIEQDKIAVWSKITASAVQNGVFTFSREEVGSTDGFEVFDGDKPEVLGEKIAKRAVEQLEAKAPKGGLYPVVLGPNVVGVLMHEAFGHLSEADLTLSSGLLLGAIGKKIASNLVTCYDDGTINGAFGSFKYDDEGVPAQKTPLIKEGVVAGLMHNRETAMKFGVAPTGNARAEDFHVEPIIRMRNTFMEPRDCSLEELLEEVKQGYYFKTFIGGQANLDGTFQVGIQEGYEIVKGKLGKPVRYASISGNTLETLFKVEAVGRDFELSPGRCGKGQTAFVCDGGPHIRVKEMLVGGSSK